MIEVRMVGFVIGRDGLYDGGHVKKDMIGRTV
jgi:hypothetical protein